MFRKIIPNSFKSLLRTYAKKIFGFKELYELRSEASRELLKEREVEEKGIPKIDLEQKHINNLKVLLDRNAFLNAMPKNGICAEIGVNKGEFSDMILSQTTPQKLHLIDAWGDPARYHDGLKDFVRDKFKIEIAEKKVEINIGFSTTILKKFPDHYFDWVYLDTVHIYSVTAEELTILKDKVKPGGIIAGHDYTIGNWVGACRYGVVEAVHELCVKDGWELIYITTETHQCRNFAIRKLKL